MLPVHIISKIVMKYLPPVRPKWVVKLISAQNLLKFDIDIANIIMKYSKMLRFIEISTI